ncbi:MAG: hypothetical protein Ct9H90mP9_5360 [Pseudomonadota bacterium]|nr:MAG: hypothetical protein Ct9H90mP9_5360 [Pseudomonadota bacterium]
MMSLGATFVGLMIDSEKSMNRDQLQDLIDELGILSLILDLIWKRKPFQGSPIRSIKSFLQKQH